jgi:hypothetical protein
MVFVLLAIGFVAAGCSKSNEQTTVEAPSGPASFTLGTAPKTVDGNVVTIPATVKGLTLAKANGDTSGKTGHFHIFIDKPVVAVGATIPVEPGVVHTPANPIKLYGLKVGTHTLRVVLGDGVHRRLPPAEQDVTVDVKGPSVWGTAPATLTKGQPYTIQGHYHILVDPKDPPKAGAALPEPSPNKVIHTGESSVTIKDLPVGLHTIFIVAGDTSHVAFDPAVMDKLSVLVK